MKTDVSRVLLGKCNLPEEYRLHGHWETFLDTRETSVHHLFGTKEANLKVFQELTELLYSRSKLSLL